MRDHKTWKAAIRRLLIVEIALIGAVLVLLPGIALWRGKTEPGELRALGLARGSVRSMLALLIVGSTINFLLFGSEVAGDSFSEVVAALGTLSASVLGFYFGGRTATKNPNEK